MARQQQAQRIAKQQQQTNAVQTQQNARSAARKGAMANDPKAAQGEAPTFKYQENQAAYGGLSQNQQNRYRTILANKGRAAANKFLQTASGGQVVMPGGKRVGQPAGPEAPTPESVTEEGFMGAGEVYQGMLDRFQNTDPYQMGQMYQGAFGQEMDRYRQSMMDQFNRRNQEEFQRQDIATQQQIAERGLDPNSPAAQALMKANTQRQDLARQEAMSAAEQGAYGVQQQAFGQAYQTAMSPYEQFGILQQPYMAGIQAQYGQQQLAQQQQYAKELAALENKYRLQQIRATPRGGGGGQAGPTLYERMQANALGQGYGQGQQQINPWAAGASAAATGFGTALGAGLAKGVS